MGCEECGTDGASSIRVSYTTGETETLDLCSDCQAAYSRGALVREVTPENP